MKAILFSGKDKPVVTGIVPQPVVNEEQVLIRLHYAALNHLDIWRIKEQPALFQGPVILGSDGAGIIESVGKSVSGLEPGQKVMINPGLNWGTDIKGPASSFRILGYPDNGVFAEYVAVDQSGVYSIPANLSLKEAAAIPLAGITAYRALFTRGGLCKGQNVLITGIGGGVAQIMLQFAVAEGANVYVSSGSNEKIYFALEHGAISGFNYKNKDWVTEAMRVIPDGFDLIVDSAAGDGFLSLIELTRIGGTIVFFGRTAGVIPPLAPGKLFNKQINLLGTTMGSPQEFKAMLEYYERHQLHPVIDSVFDIDDINQALHRMETGNHIGKILLKII
jgi:zinc-binding alcohol dehydrogenase/oxidoreductase